MKIPKSCKIEQVSDLTQNRLAISEPFLRGDKMVATNGHAMVVIPVERGEHDTDGYISGPALAMARKQCPRGENMAEITANGSLAMRDGTTMRRDDLGGCVFPNYEQCIPKEPTVSHTHRVTLDFKKLAQVVAALGADEIVLCMQDEKNPVMIYSAGYNGAAGAYGILMPVRST